MIIEYDMRVIVSDSRMNLVFDIRTVCLEASVQRNSIQYMRALFITLGTQLLLITLLPIRLWLKNVSTYERAFVMWDVRKLKMACILYMRSSELRMWKLLAARCLQLSWFLACLLFDPQNRWDLYLRNRYWLGGLTRHLIPEDNKLLKCI
jgi:hypothetical protein